MSKIAQNKERKRRTILVAAQTVFLSEGYGQASMDKIAAQAQVTKQTVYRYFPAKIDLFQAALAEMGESFEDSFLSHLKNADTREALLDFAKGFIRFHLSDKHIATFRLLVAESTREPEITQSFLVIGPDKTTETLSAFFSERLNIKSPESIICLWTGMLLEPRSGVLIGMAKPDEQNINDHAREATNFLLSALV